MNANEINVMTFSGAQAAHVLVQSRNSCQATYTVVSGDNCVAIAAKFNVTDASLLAANPVRLKIFHPFLNKTSLTMVGFGYQM